MTKELVSCLLGMVSAKSDIVCMWDPSTRRVIVTRDIIWLKRLHIQPDEVAGVLDLDRVEDQDTSDILVNTVKTGKTGGKVAWSDPIVTAASQNTVIRLGRVIKPPDRLTYTPVVESRYVGITVELDKMELTVHT